MKTILIFVLAILSIKCHAQKIIGYFPNYRYSAAYQNVQYQNLTHLYYFSLNPRRTANGQSDGSLWFNDMYSWFNTNNFNNVTAKAREINPDIKIFIVSGGAPGNDWDLNDRFMYIATHEGRLNSFCNNILNFIKTNNLDGWDLDWEYPRTAVERNAHEHMLKTMRTKIDSMKIADCKPYEISIAVGGA